ncbi:MAG TPA: GNAT family N-acetyltransferase [Vicinamibacterales bacterium]|nr:GNAT family N-acetyltransferase [Vicinamibacterales bacterium]
MQIEIRRFEGDTRGWTDLVWVAFGERFNEADLPVFEAAHEPARALAAYDGGRPVGAAGIFSFSLTVPGAELPAAGVTTVGVHPTHRRRGILRQLMRRQLDDVRAAGEPLAVLWASEGGIYQRFGYGLATLGLSFDVDRHRTAFRTPFEPAGSVRLVERDEATRLMPHIYDRFRPTRPGCYTRSAANWEAESFHDPEHSRNGGSQRFYAIHETDGMPDGYIAYRIFGKWGPRGAAGKLDVNELLGLSSHAERDLWRYAFDVDLMATTSTWNVPVDSPLLLWLAEPRRLGAMIGDALWLRIVDVAGALEGRRYAADGELTFELADAFMPDNAGAWTLEAGPDGARVRHGSHGAGLALDTTDLAAMYLGTFSASRLVRAGRAQELAPGAAALADRLFATDVAPWCSKVF